MKLADMPGTDGDFIKVKYVLPKRGSHDVIGSNAINPMNGRKFNYGQHSFGDVFLVHRDDVYMTDRRSGQQVFRDPSRFQPVEERVVEPPPAGPKVTLPPVPIVESIQPIIKEDPGVTEIIEWIHPDGTRFVPLPPESLDQTTIVLVEEKAPAFDFQILPGVNAKIAAELEVLGLESREDILKFGVEGLATVKGIGEKKARKIVEYLS